jgi:FixJ family two-component response regulator
MPDGMNGDELGRRLATLRPDLPVIYMSGYGAEEAAAQWMLREGVDFLAKPFSVEELLTLVKTKLARAAD